MSTSTTLPELEKARVLDDVEGCEFVDGEWQEKHPTEWIEEEHDRRGCEFVDGQWVEKDMSVSSDAVIVNLLAALQPYVRERKLGRVQGPECGYQIFPIEPKRVRKPDVSFISATRALPELLNGNAKVAPDFAAEVTSPRDKVDALNRKIEEYFSVGVKLVWIVFPKTKSVWILRIDGSGNRIVGTGELSGENIIPGFTITLETLFAED